MTGDDTPYFRVVDGHFVPSKFCLGYWSPGTLNGRIICGLMGHAIDKTFGAPDLVPVRLAVDLLRLVPNAPLRIDTDIVRAGQRTIFARARLWCGDAMLAQANAILARVSDNPQTATFQSPTWQVPQPEDLASRPNPQHLDLRPIPPARDLRDVAQHALNLDDSPLGNAHRHPEGRRYWVQDLRNMVGDDSNSAFVRVAMLADFASPLANGSAKSLDYINTDMTLYLHRLPTDAWFGFEFMKHNADQGVAIGECWLYDRLGPLGTINVAAIANSPRRA